MNVVFATDVWDEVETARAYYENEVTGLGAAFVLTIYRSIDEIKRYPTASRLIKKPYRRFLTPRFPFGIIYRIEQDALYITAVSHLRKKPFYWNER